MAGFSINYRRHRVQMFHPAFKGTSPQVQRSGQTVSPTGAAVAVRPPRVGLRRMDNRGVGSVGTF